MNPATPKQRADLIAFVEREYEMTNSLAASGSTAVVASRSIGFTLVAGILGFGFGNDSWPLLALGFILVSISYIVDGYYSWRMEEFELYLRDLEDILAHHYAAVWRAPNNAQQLGRLDRRLRSLRVGAVSRIRNFGPKDLYYGKPRAMFIGLYPVLLVASLIGAIVVGC